MLCQLSYAPELRGRIVPRPPSGTITAWQDPRVHRRALGALFSVLALAFALIAVFSALQGGRALVIALAAAVLALWMGSLARSALRRPR